ncbi:MAG: alpha/beta fold hydrolase [Gammaproteobacteria bacterium]
MTSPEQIHTATDQSRDAAAWGSRPPPDDNARGALLATLPVSERQLQLADVSTAVLDGGSGSRIVLLHGPGGYAAHWMRVIPTLVATHRVIAPDLPGHGASEVYDGSLDAERVLAWLGELIDQTCGSPPVLVGHLVGGAIAARFATRHGRRVRRLVLIDTFGLQPFEPAPAFGLALHDFVAQPNERTHELLGRQCAFDLDALRRSMGRRWEPFVAYNLDRMRTPSVQAAMHALMQQFGQAIARVELERIGMPTTLIWGRHDLATPLAVAEAASRRYGWPLHVIEEANDDPPIEQPEALLRVLRTALGTVKP